MDALKGSSQSKPWILDDTGQLILSDTKNTAMNPWFFNSAGKLELSCARKEAKEEPATLHVPAAPVNATAAASLPNAMGSRGRRLPGNHIIGGPSFVEQSAELSALERSWIEGHALALAEPATRAATLRRARKRASMHPAEAGA
ncbi:hypothetical protein C8F04DRAFT_1261212 [Mycena alexandri]|uniref:Uncharacterized protein n=1 Tax=Mycena alexandri TaxID=1745969 RepID=A0AAD6SU38_9AGAR|nr:hypothetical protein C8F04DRAFT_1261212 [Mycena alexandri]